MDAVNNTRTQIVAIVIAMFISLSGLLVLVGWAADVEILRSMSSGFVPMKANAAVCFVLIGCSLGSRSIQSFYPKVKYLKLTAKLTAYIVLFIATFTLIEYIFNVDFGIDQLLFKDKILLYPGRMAINAAISFVLLAYAILYFDATTIIKEHASQFLAFLVVVISIASIFGYVTGERIFATAFSGYALIAINAAILLFFSAINIFLAQPNKALTAAITSGNSSGILLRHTLPLFLIATLFLGWISITLVKMQIVTPVYAIVFYCLINIFVFTVTLWIVAMRLNAIEIDPLTKIRNRYRLYNIMSHEINRAKRYNRELSVLFVDIDDFKNFNDIYGHANGDKVLMKLAELIAKTLRPSDYVFRYGGEEFLILLPETDKDGAFNIAERLRKKFYAIKFLHAMHKHGVRKTISIGISEYTHKVKARKLIADADKAMYQAKRSGKNQVCMLDN